MKKKKINELNKGTKEKNNNNNSKIITCVSGVKLKEERMCKSCEIKKGEENILLRN